MNDHTQTAKQQLRRQAIDSRAAIAERTAKSQVIWQQVQTHLNLGQIPSVCSYIGVGTEVETTPGLRARLAAVNPQHTNVKTLDQPEPLTVWQKTIVPFCLRNTLELYRIDQWEEVGPSRFGLLEPRSNIRVPSRLVDPIEIDVFLVPGLAFDLQGHRLGYGKGFYDRLLQHKKRTAVTVALAFEQQIQDEVPHDATYDHPVDFIATESRWIVCERP